jgi:hypothetical protein
MPEVPPPAKRPPLPVQFDPVERSIIEGLASLWGLSYSGVVRRIVRESNKLLPYPNQVSIKVNSTPAEKQKALN